MASGLDPRVKIGILCIVNLLVYFSIDYLLEVLCVLLTAGCLAYQRQYGAMIGYVILYAAVAALALLLVSAHGTAAIGFGAFLGMMRKMIPIFMAGTALLRSDSGQLICGLQKLHFPRPLVVALAVILRFFPTMKEEFLCIRDAMRIRGIPLTAGNCLRHPLKMMEFILVPLISRLAVVSDELSAAAITRGMESQSRRTSYYALQIGMADVLFLILFLALLTADFLPRMGVRLD